MGVQAGKSADVHVNGLDSSSACPFVPDAVESIVQQQNETECDDVTETQFVVRSNVTVSIPTSQQPYL